MQLLALRYTCIKLCDDLLGWAENRLIAWSDSPDQGVPRLRNFTVVITMTPTRSAGVGPSPPSRTMPNPLFMKCLVLREEDGASHRYAESCEIWPEDVGVG